jgi:uncharacterized protein YndB with AHSA1/START domain
MTSVQNDEVRVELTVEAPIETAFKVFTEGIDTWWPRGHYLGSGEMVEKVLEPRVGGKLYGREADGTRCSSGTVLVWDPPKHVAFSWEISLEWQAQSDPELASRVDVAFAAEGPNRTAVTLVHSGFERHGTGWESMRDGVAGEGGWPDMVNTFAKAAAAA